MNFPRLASRNAWLPFLSSTFFLFCAHARADEKVRVIILSKYHPSSIQIKADNIQSSSGTVLGSSIRVKAEQGLVILSFGTKKQKLKNLTVSVSSPAQIIFGSPPAKRLVYGRLSIRVKSGSLFIIDEVPLEEYVSAVMVSETQDIYQRQALSALAVITRSYALAERGRHKKEGADFCDLTHCQVYRVPKSIPEVVSSAVTQTAHQVLMYEGHVAETFYHACCGGRTEDAHSIWKNVSAPYLRSVSDQIPNEKTYYCANNKHFRWTSTISNSDLRRVAAKAGWMNTKEAVSLTIVEKTPSGRVATLLLKSGKKKAHVSGPHFYRAVGKTLGWKKVKSTLFDIHACGQTKRSVCFDGFGYGHGVGLCQDGADGMAKAGHDYKEILSHYFPGTTLELLKTTED